VPTKKKAAAKKKVVKKKPQTGVKANAMPKEGAPHSSVQRDEDGIPLAEPPRHKSLVGNRPPPDTGGDPQLERERVSGQIEILLLKGITSPWTISQMLGCSFRTARDHIKKIYYRWDLLGGMPRMRQLRGEAKSRLSLITQELWVIAQNSDDPRIKLVALNQLVGCHDRQMLLDGLTANTLPRVAAEDGPDEASGSKELSLQEMHHIAAQLQEYIDAENQQHRTIEAEVVS
jgi:hypothetical protein